MKILIQGWTQIPHSYAIVNCFQLIHLQKEFSDILEIYIKEEPYFNSEWNNSKQLIYPKEYNEILLQLPKWNGEKVDLVYNITYEYNITDPCIETNQFKNVPKCVFYTSEFAHLTESYFSIFKDSTKYKFGTIKDVKRHLNLLKDKLFFTSPSKWSSEGITKISDEIIPDSNNRIITHGVDRTIFYLHSTQTKRRQIREFYNIKDTDILLINIGAMTQNKGIMLILQALHELVNKKNKKQYKLLLKGTGELYDSKKFLQQYLEFFKQQNKITIQEESVLLEHIIFTNKTISYERINDLFNAADLYISPYLAEGFNLTVLESLATGLPVLVPETGSTEEYINTIEGNGGRDFIYKVHSTVLLFNNGMMQNNIHVSDIVQCIESNESDLTRMKNDRYNKYILIDKVLDKYTWKTVVHELVDYFKFIIDKCN